MDRLGRKRLLIVATVLYAVFGTAPLWLDSLGAIMASRALVGITEAAIMTCCTTLIGDYYTGRGPGQLPRPADHVRLRVRHRLLRPRRRRRLGGLARALLGLRRRACCSPR